ncbi:diheme cytochrome c [Desulfovibrio sp. X2]|uniref:diheme cytochrome c n=1 Tax=Desulfovibrio sp. X2 TaxID=941449 RepID=UPI0012681B3A|nr:diheme cytochrome c [Desulfovibrio sp. X2]
MRIDLDGSERNFLSFFFFRGNLKEIQKSTKTNQSEKFDMYRASILMVLAMFFSSLAPFAAEADDHGRHDRHRERHRGQELVEDAVPAPANDLYIKTCGSCHMAYPPALLNAASWSALIHGSDDHFGNALSLDENDAQELERYLKESAAENAPGELARDISEDLGNRVVLRITDVPEIRKEHRKIRAEVLSRQSIGSLSNCIACHTGADRGVFDDDSVRIPHE